MIISFSIITILIGISNLSDLYSIDGEICNVDVIKSFVSAGNSNRNALPLLLFNPNYDLLSLIKILLMIIVEVDNIISEK
jgi:hypothetical protein